MRKARPFLIGLLVATLPACGSSAAMLAFARLPSVAGPASPRDGAALGARATGGSVLELLTYNIWGKPGILGTDQARRMGLIAPAIRPFQIVALQEAFTAHADLIATRSGFPFQAWHREKKWFDITTSGLFTLTNFAQDEVDFAPFEQEATWDRFANKGVLFTRLRVPGVGCVDVYNTHYQAENPYGKIREHDNGVLAALVKKHDTGWPTFLLGDFNMTADSPEYRDLMARLAPRDGWLEANPEAPGYTVDPGNTNKPDTKGAERIDYVFALPRERWDVRFERLAIAMNEPVAGGHLSDHFGVQASVRILPKP